MDQIQNEWVWWKHGVIYHIYPLSFFDSNNDGKGDLRGVILKLDYLKNLGIDAIWLSPIFQSPFADFGYDVSDYYTIDPVFGIFDDFKELLFQAHERKIRIILDIVLNHTSEDHPWFIESRKDLTNPKRSWYIWQPTRGRRKPNNWKNAFGGSCWEYDTITREYYLHSFLKGQPDLNWRNKEVRNEMFKMLNYWQELGVDGFRFDVINFIIKDKRLRNNPFLYWLSSERKIRTRNHAKSYRIIRKLRKTLDKYPDCMSVGEIYALPPGDPALSASYLMKEKSLLHLTFDFSMFFVNWNARKYFKAIQKWQNNIPEEGWPTNVFSNHDLFRSFNRIGIGSHKEQKARLHALMLMTLRGTPFIYYGDEIGMKNVTIPRKKLKDPLGKRYWPFFKGRDRARTPMQWNESKNAGFTDSQPWLPPDKDYSKVNVEHQNNYADSLLNMYRELIKMRHINPALSQGAWIPDCDGKKGTISYYRKTETENILIIINFTSSRKKYFREFNTGDKIIFSTTSRSNKQLCTHFYTLQAFEGVIVQLCN